MNEAHLETLRALANNPALSQRAIARELNLSIGKVNYIIKALVEKGLIKMKRFHNSDNKLGYMYVLTPEGIKMRVLLTTAFIKRKSEDYQILRAEIAELQKELKDFGEKRT